MAFALGGQNYFLDESGGSSGASPGYPSTPAPAGAMLMAFICSPDRACPTPAGYTSLGPKVAVNGLFFDVFYAIAAGGETSVTLDYGTPTAFAGHVRWYTDPPSPTLYEIASLLTQSGGTTSLDLLQDADMSADAQPLLAAVAFLGHIFGGVTGANPSSIGADALTWANVSPGGFNLQAFGGLVEADDITDTLVAADRYGAGFPFNGSAVDDDDLVGYLLAWGSGPPPPVSIAGVATLGLGGSGDLSADPGPVEIEGHATLGLGGTGELSIEGGTVSIAGEASLGLGGTGRLTIFSPLPLPPVTYPASVLGCGVYEVLAFTRGGVEILGNLEFDEVDWGRKLDATSAATLTIDGTSNAGALERCCQTLSELEPWEHELAIYRQVPGSQNQKKRVWSGPITRMRFPNEQCIIEAFDLSQWLVVRTLHANHNFVQADLISMWVGWVEDAMGIENSAGLHPTVVALAGTLGDRLTTIIEHDYAADVIAEIATTGIDWTTIDRVMQAGPVLRQPAGQPGSGTDFPLLVDESFRVAPEIIVDGMAGGNCWFVNGGGIGGGGNPIFGEYGPAFPATPDHVAQPAAPDYAAIERQFGRIESTVSETKILDQPSIDQAARTRYDLSKRPMPYITGGELLPTAPLPIDKIIPGFLVNVHLQRACKPVAATMRMNQLDVTGNNDGSEGVNLGLEPIGTVA